MKKFFAATAVASLLIFGGQTTEASTVENFDTTIEAQNFGDLANSGDKISLSNLDKVERKRREWERRHRYYYDRDYYGDRRRYPHPPPPPPPPIRPGYGPMPPPPMPAPPPRRW